MLWQCWHSIQAGSPAPPSHEVGKRWGGDVVEAAELNQVRGQAMLCGIMLSNESWGRGRRRGAPTIKVSVFLSNRGL